MNNAERAKIYRAQRQSKGICTVGGCGNPLRTKWLCDKCSKKYGKIINKARNERRLNLVNNGLCSNDDCGKSLVTKWFCRECADKINQYARNWWNKNIIINKRKARIRNHINRFSGLRENVLKRDNGICQICFRENKKIHVHHINENDKDNRMENLICLCFICHIVVERMNRTRPDLRHLFPWFQ